jgi:hypothetical protein
MPERPKFEGLAPPSIERNEEEKFWDEEIAEWTARQYDKTRAQKLTRNQIIHELYNNLPLWLPSEIAGSTIGAYRQAGGSIDYRTSDDAEYRAKAERLVKDIDEYLDRNHLTDMMRAVAEQQTAKGKAIIESFGKRTRPEDITWEKTLSEGEIEEFYRDLYMYLRNKGYVREDIAT